jgi:peptidyl-prolyl cis-trans isomerase C
MKQKNHQTTARVARVLIATAAVFCTHLAVAQNLAVVNGKPIPKARADELVAQAVKAGQTDSPELQNAVREQLITRELLLQEAAKAGLQNNPDVQLQMELSRQQVLIAALAQDYFKANPPTDAEVKAQYDQLVKEMPSKEYHVRHILVDKEADAKAIIAKLKSGAKFEDLAKASSKDTGSAANGGDLDWAQPGSFVKEFSNAMVKLPKGKVTDTPVKTQFGYHVIRVDDIRDAKAPTFAEAKPQIIQGMQQNQQWQQAKFRAMIDSLRSKAKIE